MWRHLRSCCWPPRYWSCDSSSETPTMEKVTVLATHDTRTMRLVGLGRSLCRTVLAAAFGFMSLHVPVMPIGSVHDHQAGLAIVLQLDQGAESADHTPHHHHAPSRPEAAPMCVALACCVALVPPAIAPALLLSLAGPLRTSPGPRIRGIDPAPPDPPPRLQA